MNAKPNLNAGVWLFVEALCILSYTVKSLRLRRAFFVAIVATCTYALTCTMTDFTRYGMGIRGISSRLPMVVLFASSNILLCDPQKDLRRVGQKENIHDAPFLSRLWWGLLLWANPRGINYAHEPTAALPPRPQQTTKTTFVLAQLKSILWYFLLFDVLGIMNRANPYYTKGTPIVAGFEHLWWLAGFGFGAMIYSLTSIQYKIPVIVLVVLGISNPRDCPYFYGSPLDAYTVRRMWSKSWHQLLRRGCLSHAEYVATYLRLPPKTKTTTALKLFIGFFLSGIIHWISEAVPMQSLSESIGTLAFFLLQVAGIMAEEFVMEYAQRYYGVAKSTPWTKAIGFVWVFLWFNFSLPYWTVPGYKGGWAEEFPDFSVMLGLWKGEWFPVNKSTR